jgi:CBS domain-containing membrane protein/CBS domain-containing protein
MDIIEPCREAGEVRDLMTPDPMTVPPDTASAEVQRMMDERRFRHMLVCDEAGHVLGLVSQRDLLSVGSQGDSDRPISELMQRNVDTVRPECCAAEVARHMLRSKRSCLPVVGEEDVVVGILTEADFLRLATRDVPPCSCGGLTPVG